VIGPDLGDLDLDFCGRRWIRFYHAAGDEQ
jgi:hypothetical protein